MGSVLSTQATPAPVPHSKLAPSSSSSTQSSPDPVVPTPQPAIATKPIPQATPLSTSRQRRVLISTRSRTTASHKEKKLWYQPLIRKNSTKRAKKCALAVHSLITGAQPAADPKSNKSMALTQLKSELLKPKTANRIIAELRKLPVDGNDLSKELDNPRPTAGALPIHAVCLGQADAKADELYFSKFAADATPGGNFDIASALQLDTTSIDKFTQWLDDIHVIDLITAPDLGLGQPGDGAGILAGAVPTAETVIKGIEQITPQLMALGFAVGKAILPDHKGVFPPTDRISVLTYWWGLEVLLPPPTLDYLSTAQSISGAVMNFLTAVSLVYNGVREILPLARYISQFIDFEFNQIRKQDHGKGVVCAATWVLPAALVPRPWDFEDRPAAPTNPTEDKDDQGPAVPTNPTEDKDDHSPAVPTNPTEDKDDHGADPSL